MIDFTELPDDLEIDFGIKRSRFPASVDAFRVFIIRDGPIHTSWEGFGATREEAYAKALQDWKDNQ